MSVCIPFYMRLFSIAEFIYFARTKVTLMKIENSRRYVSLRRLENDIFFMKLNNKCVYYSLSGYWLIGVFFPLFLPVSTMSRKRNREKDFIDAEPMSFLIIQNRKE